MTNSDLIKLLGEQSELIAANSLINSYALENVVMGNILPNETIFLKEYLATLELDENPLIAQNIRQYIDGSIVNKNLQIVERDLNEYYLEFFSDKMHVIFYKEMRWEYFDKYDYLQFNDELRNYLLDIFELFKQIANTPVKPVELDLYLKCADEEIINKDYDKFDKFVFAIPKRHLRIGSRVERFFKDVHIMPYGIDLLLKRVGGHKVLKINDTNSIEYKLAILSLIRFKNMQNYQLFNIKMRIWKNNLNL